MDNVCNTKGKITACDTEAIDFTRKNNANLRLSDDENEKLMKLVDASGLTKSEYIRKRILTSEENVIVIDVNKLLSELANIATLLSELSFALNKEYEISNIDEKAYFRAIHMRLEDVSQAQANIDLEIVKLIEKCEGVR